jgi:hypothetical protein
MAKLKPSRICAHCAQPVKHGADFLQPHLWGAMVRFHWACFISLLNGHHRRQADSAAGAIPNPGYYAG